MTLAPVQLKRSQYFTPPTTEHPHSSRHHYFDWEEYHRPLAQMHHSHLHDWGVATGLTVSVAEEGGAIEIQPGVAVDGNGELISLSGSGEADISLVQPGEPDRQIPAPFRMTILGLAGQTSYLTIQFAERLLFGEGSGGKLEQTPWLRLQPATGDGAYVEDGTAIVLAVLVVDIDGKATVAAGIPSLPHGRRTLATTVSAVHFVRSTAQDGIVGERAAARFEAGNGDLRVSVAAAESRMILQQQADGQFAQFVVQAQETNVNGSLQIHGNLDISAPGSTPYRIYSDGGSLHVADQDSALDRLLIDRTGNIGLGTSDTSGYKLNVEGGDIRFAGALTVNEIHVAQAGFASIHYGNRGRLGSAPNFNPDSDQNGLWIEGSADGSESGGLFVNGNTVCLWSPGDSDLLRIYDEDEMDGVQIQPKVVVSGMGDVGIGTALPQGKLDVQGDIRAGDSSIYFTKVEHAHSGLGNATGWAAIENAADYDALMILGRAGTPRGRNVRLWDYLQVNGSMDVTGNLGVGTSSPSHRFHVVAPDAVGLFESSGGQAYLRLSTNEGIGNRVEITNRPGGTLTLWTAGGGDVFRIARNGQIIVGGNLSGPFVRFNDDLWFYDPQNGTIELRNASINQWGTMVGFFRPPSSRTYKREIVPLTDGDSQLLLQDTLDTGLVRFNYNADPAECRPRLGVIVEECPTYLVGEDGKSLSTVEYVSMLHGAIKALAQELESLRDQTRIQLENLGNAGTGAAHA
jgi:hypothetical protein